MTRTERALLVAAVIWWCCVAAAVYALKPSRSTSIAGAGGLSPVPQDRPHERTGV